MRSRSSEILQDEWQGCYRQGYGDLLIPDAYSHPAKMSRGLVFRIVDHAIEEGWISEGGWVLDPFGGIGTTALPCILKGVNVVTCELEPKFVELSKQNREMWARRFAGLRELGEWVILQGDSRRLGEVIAEAVLVLSSPPYANSLQEEDPAQTAKKQARIARSKSLYDGRAIEAPSSGKAGMGSGYGESPGQLANLPATEEGFNLSLSSPPFAGAQQTDKRGLDHPLQRGKFVGSDTWGKPTQYHNPDSEGQLGAMKESAEGLRLAISSPPYVESVGSDEPEKRGGLFRDPKRKGDKTLTATYGESEGQLGAMRESREGFNVSVSSPPFMLSDQRMRDAETRGQFRRRDGSDAGLGRSIGHAYGDENCSDGKRGGDRKGPKAASERRARVGAIRNLGHIVGVGEKGLINTDDFWTAARLIVEQTYSVLRPGSHAVWVCKRFVRNGQIVDFPGQWAKLCEAVGFRLIHHHKAMLVEHSGTQFGLDGNHQQIKVERKSFFRRLHENRRPDLSIDWEDVLCMERR